MVLTEIRVPLMTGWPPHKRGLISMRSLMSVPYPHRRTTASVRYFDLLRFQIKDVLALMQPPQKE
jgi:hypothetical protein